MALVLDAEDRLASFRSSVESALLQLNGDLNEAIRTLRGRLAEVEDPAIEEAFDDLVEDLSSAFSDASAELGL